MLTDFHNSFDVQILDTFAKELVQFPPRVTSLPCKMGKFEIVVKSRENIQLSVEFNFSS